MENKIDITGVDLIKLTKKAYELSKPQRNGFLHYIPGELPAHCAQSMIDEWANDERIALRLDHISGRSCKLTVYRDGEKLFIADKWYDHTESQLKELVDAVTAQV